MKFALLAILATIALAAPAPEADANIHEVDLERDLAAAHADVVRDTTLIQAREDVEAAEAAEADDKDEDGSNQAKAAGRPHWEWPYFIGYAKTGVNCRARPTTDSPIRGYYGAGHRVPIYCQTTGQKVNGLVIWDRTSRGCYVSDSLVKTGHEWIPRPMRKC